MFLKNLTKCLLGILAFFVLILPVHAENKDADQKNQSSVSEVSGQQLADYLKEQYVQQKMAINDEIENYKAKYRDFSQTEDYKKLVKEDPELERFVGKMSVALNDLSTEVDQAYLIYLKPYQEELAKIKADHQAGKLKLTEEVAKFVSDYTLTEPEKIKKKKYNQDELLVHWKKFAYYKQSLFLSDRLETIYQSYFSQLAALPEDKQTYAANRDTIQEMYQEFVKDLEFVEAMSKEELDQIDEKLSQLQKKVDQLKNKPIQNAVKDKNLFE